MPCAGGPPLESERMAVSSVVFKNSVFVWTPLEAFESGHLQRSLRNDPKRTVNHHPRSGIVPVCDSSVHQPGPGSLESFSVKKFTPIGETVHAGRGYRSINHGLCRNLPRAVTLSSRGDDDQKIKKQSVIKNYCVRIIE